MAQDPNELVRTKTVCLLPEAILSLAVLDQAQILRMASPGNTILKIESSNHMWVGVLVSVLPDPTMTETTKALRVQPVETLKALELKIYYYDAFEVEKS